MCRFFILGIFLCTLSAFANKRQPSGCDTLRYWLDRSGGFYFVHDEMYRYSNNPNLPDHWCGSHQGTFAVKRIPKSLVYTFEVTEWQSQKFDEGRYCRSSGTKPNLQGLRGTITFEEYLDKYPDQSGNSSGACVLKTNSDYLFLNSMMSKAVFIMHGYSHQYRERFDVIHSSCSLYPGGSSNLCFPSLTPFKVASLPPITSVKKPVCERHEAVRSEIERRSWGRKCNDITVKELSHLEDMFFVDADLTGIESADFEGLINLKFLHLRKNRLAQLPSDLLTFLPSLLRLDVVENDLTEIPQGFFKNAKNLMAVNFFQNRLTSMDWVTDIPFLAHLDLEGNQITRPTLKPGSPALELSYMNLAKNRITHFPLSLSPITGFLTHLDLSGNRITIIDNGVFDYSKHLKTINLRENSLMDLDLIPFEPFFNSTLTLDLRENEFSELKKKEIRQKFWNVFF